MRTTPGGRGSKKVFLPCDHCPRTKVVDYDVRSSAGRESRPFFGEMSVIMSKWHCGIQYTVENKRKITAEHEKLFVSLFE